MFRIRTMLAAAALIAPLAIAPAGALDLTIEVDHARAIRLPEPASAVIVGNPVIADVTPHDASLFLLTGKTFGATNVIALDDEGRQIYEARINVVDAGSGRLVVNRGLARESYVCAGDCQRLPIPGDSTASFDALAEARAKALEAGNAEARPR